MKRNLVARILGILIVLALCFLLETTSVLLPTGRLDSGPTSDVSAATYVAAPTLVYPAKGAWVTGTSVIFQWNEVGSAAGYKLVVSTSYKVLDSTKYKCNIDLSGGDNTTYEDTGYPSDGTKYFWWVWAYDAGRNYSAWSEVRPKGRWFTNSPIEVGAPALVSPGNGEGLPGGSVLFEWGTVSGAEGYKLVVSTSYKVLDSTKYKCNVDLIGNDNTSYEDTGYPSDGTKYFWWVWANAGGNSSAWSEVKPKGRWFTNSPIEVGAPALVSPGNGEGVPGGSVLFEWGTVSGAESYKLVVSSSYKVLDSTKYKCNVDLVDLGSGLPTSYEDTGYRSDGTQYFWWVWAFNAGGNHSAWSEVKANGGWFTNDRVYIGAPALVSPSNGEVVPGGSVLFEWGAVGGAERYKLVVSSSYKVLDSTKYKCNVDLVDLGSGLPTSYEDTGYPNDGTHYFWWVWAYSAEGSHSAWSEVKLNGRWFINASGGGSSSSSVGDLVWEDLNWDGDQDQGEGGLNNVNIELYSCAGSLVSSTTTDAGGSYLFSNLAPGSYYVRFVAPPGYVFSATASDPDADGITECFDLVANQSDLTRDAGLYLSQSEANASVGDFVWEDRNGNGLQDDGDSGLDGVVVNLLDCSDQLVATTTTNASGFYAFAGVTPGDYKFEFVAEPIYVFTATGQGGDPAKDSDAHGNGKTDCFTLAAAQDDLNRDAGLYRLASIGDFVWEDADANGIQDAGEDGIAGVVVNLLDCGDQLVTTTTTNASGFYEFAGVAPGDYKVGFEAPSGYAFSLKDQTSDDKDSDAHGDGKTDCFTLFSGQDDLGQDAGLCGLSSIEGFVWEDANVDGIQGAGEEGIAGVVVNLLDCNGQPITATTTNASGLYTFADVTPGGYKVGFEAPSGYAFSLKDRTSDDKDSDANPADGKTDCFTLIAGQDNLELDAGLYERASFDPLVWKDLNGNGVQDLGEAGLCNVTVELRRCDGSLVASTATDAGGYYAFSNLTPGSYYLEFVAPAGYFFSPKGQGGNAARDSDANADGRTDCFSVVSGENDIVRDAGLYRQASIGDFVWEDVNEDGIQNEDERGLGDVTVELHTSDGWSVASTATDDSGHYIFSNLTPGSYYLKFVAPAGYRYSPASQGGDGVIDSDALQRTGETECFGLASGERGSIWDAGLYHADRSTPSSFPAFATWGLLGGMAVIVAGSGLLVLRGKVLMGDR